PAQSRRRCAARGPVAFASATARLASRARGGEGMAATAAGTEPRVRSPGRGGRPSRLESALLSDRILDVATALFLGDGYGATSIEAVARRAHISKRTFYHRFPGKEALFEAAVRRLIERWMPRFDADLPAAPTLVETLRRTAEYMLAAALTPEALALHRIAIA